MSRSHWPLTLKRLAAGCVVLAAAACGGDDKSDGPAGAGKGGAGRAGSGGAHAAGTAGTAGTRTGGSGGTGGADGGAAGNGGAGGETGGSDGRAGAGAGAGQRFFSGVVAGYIEGASVFLNLDGDFEPGAKEPTATTDARGRFSLPLSGDVEAEKFTVVALVPDGALDSYTRDAVPNAYLLAAPAGANAFVSPFSSLAVGLLARYPSFSLDEAASAIRAKLAVSADVNLFGDYVADAKSGSDTAGESLKLQRVAQVLGWSFGIDLAEIAALPKTPALDAFTLATHNAELQLATVALAVADKALDSDHLLTLATFLSHVDRASLEERLDRSRRASPTDFYDTFAGDGTYIPFPGPNGAVGGYGRFRPSPKNRSAYLLPQQDYSWDIDTSVYVAEPPIFDAGYSLTADGWTLRTESNSAATFSSQSDGSAEQTSDVARAVQRGTMNVVELAGHLLRSYAKGIDFTDRAAVFPKGSLGYRMAVNAQKDEYLAYDDDSENPELKALTSLDAVEAAYGTDGAFLRTYSFLNLKLMSKGVVRFSSGRDEMLLPKSGSWRRRTVEGAELIEISVPVAYKVEFDLLDANTDLFLAVIDGQARSGIVTRAGLADTQDYYLLNRTAFDAVVAGAVANDDGIPVFGQVAAEGWLEGAKVYLDINDNGRLDAGEPSDTSVSNGEYSLFWSKRDFDAHSIAVSVPATATAYLPDVGRSFSVTQPFSLRAPPGETIITPFTTLAWYLLGKNPDGTYAEAQAHLADMLGTTGSLFDYVDAADADQTKLRLVAGLLVEKLKEVRGRMLANQTDADAVVLDPDNLTIYRALVGANYETLPALVMRVEALLLAPNPNADLNDYVDKNAWADMAGTITDDLFDALVAVLADVVHKMVTIFVAQIAGEIAGEVPYVGWLLGPAVKCGILESNGIDCGAV